MEGIWDGYYVDVVAVGVRVWDMAKVVRFVLNAVNVHIEIHRY